MKRFGLLMALALAAGCANSGSSDSRLPANLADRPYFELRDEQGQVWVLGSAESLSQARQGQWPEQATTKAGYGAKQETVIFEASSAQLEQDLVTLYQYHHPTAGQPATTEPAQ